MKRVFVTAVAIATLHAPPAKAKSDGCNSRSCVERVARKQCSQARPLRCLMRAALHWDVSYSMLVRKTRCESHFNPYAIYGREQNDHPDPSVFASDTSSGLMQFKPSTWLGTPYAKPYRRKGVVVDDRIWWAKWNALAGAWMHHVGRGGEWVCQ